MKTNLFIRLDRLRFHAQHGVLPQEQTIGAMFTVHLRAQVDGAEAALTNDQLEATADYAAMYACIKDEMSRPSRLLEHVAGRIGNRLFSTFPNLIYLELSIAKEAPPIQGMDGEAAVVELQMKR